MLSTINKTADTAKLFLVALICFFVWSLATTVLASDFSLFGPSKSELKATVEAQAKDLKDFKVILDKQDENMKLMRDLIKLQQESIDELSAKRGTTIAKGNTQKKKIQDTSTSIQNDTTLTEEQKADKQSAALFDLVEDYRCSYDNQICSKGAK